MSTKSHKNTKKLLGNWKLRKNCRFPGFPGFPGFQVSRFPGFRFPEPLHLRMPSFLTGKVYPLPTPAPIIRVRSAPPKIHCMAKNTVDFFEKYTVLSPIQCIAGKCIHEKNPNLIQDSIHQYTRVCQKSRLSKIAISVSLPKVLRIAEQKHIIDYIHTIDIINTIIVQKTHDHSSDCRNPHPKRCNIGQARRYQILHIFGKMTMECLYCTGIIRQ